MTHILTLVAAANCALATQRLETLAAGLREAGAATDAPIWLAPNDRACDLPPARTRSPGRR
jgi:hypothetical protein